MEKGTKVVIIAKGERNGHMGQYLGTDAAQAKSQLHQIGFPDGAVLLFKYSEFKPFSDMGSTKKRKPKAEIVVVESKSEPKPEKIDYKSIDPRTNEPYVLNGDDIKLPVQMGRPSKYTPELAAAICAGIVEGKSLRSVCRMEDMPTASTVFLWLSKYTDFSEQYARATEARSEAFAEDIIDISDDTTNDTVMVKVNGKEIEMPNKEHMLRSKLRVDTRMWLMQKAKPKKYGNKLDVTSDSKPIQGNNIIFADFSADPKANETAGK